MNARRSSLRQIALATATVVAAAVVPACDEASVERRARDAAERIQGSIRNPSALALRQEVTREEVREAQAALTMAKEYMGEINGELDSVTVNAIQAFQRSHGIADDGILNEETKRRLRELTARQPPP